MQNYQPLYVRWLCPKCEEIKSFYPTDTEAVYSCPICGLLIRLDDYGNIKVVDSKSNNE